MDPYIKIGPWIPILRAVRGSLYSGRSKDPIFKSVRGSLYSGRSMDLYMQIGPWIPILRSVRGSLSSGRSANPDIQNGPWIPICGSIRGFLSSDRSADPYILSGPWIPHKPLLYGHTSCENSLTLGRHHYHILLFELKVKLRRLSSMNNYSYYHIRKLKVKFLQESSKPNPTRFGGKILLFERNFTFNSWKCRSALTCMPSGYFVVA